MLFCTDNLDYGQFKHHGCIRVSVCNRDIMRYEVTGPLNGEMLNALRTIEDEAFVNCQQNRESWCQFVVFDENCAALESFVNQLKGHLIALKRAGQAPLATAFVLPEHIDGALFMVNQYQVCYKAAHIPFSTFTCNEHALRWLETWLNGKRS